MMRLKYSSGRFVLASTTTMLTMDLLAIRHVNMLVVLVLLTTTMPDCISSFLILPERPYTGLWSSRSRRGADCSKRRRVKGSSSSRSTTTSTISSQVWLGAPQAVVDIRRCRRRSLASSSSLEDGGVDKKGDDDEEEWHPRDPAHTTPQLLAGLWHQIAQSGSMTRGETYTVIYPELEDLLNQQPPRYLSNIMAHLDYCKDVCDHFGMTTTLTPFVDKKSEKIVGFTAKSFKNPKKVKIGTVGDAVVGDDDAAGDDDDDDEYNFGYDPFWDDGTDFDALYKGVDDIDLPKDPYPEIVNKVPNDDDVIITISKQWVQAIMSDLGICPFTSSANTAGLPVGAVHYQVTRATTVEDMYVKYWEEVVRLEQQSEKDVSTILLIAPEFFMDNVELFETFCNTLTQPLTGLQVEDLLQLVFFHPHWSFRDGGERTMSQGQAANYARRSPWPMINLLRTTQVRTAQRGIPTGLVYKQNEKTLNLITADQLETMLRLRDWTSLMMDDENNTNNNQTRVNRREMDALKIFATTNPSNVGSTSTVRGGGGGANLANDAIPVANRVVDRQQVEEGNLVYILQQALEKRLQSSSSSSSSPTGGGGRARRLTGPETSVASMATDYLIQELEKIVSLSHSDSTMVVTVDDKKSNNISSNRMSHNETDHRQDPRESNTLGQTTTAPTTTTTTRPLELEAARRANAQKARQMLLDDLAGGYESSGLSDRGSELNDVLFGRSGIQARSDDDDDIDAFRSFQGQ